MERVGCGTRSPNTEFNATTIDSGSDNKGGKGEEDGVAGARDGGDGLAFLKDGSFHIHENKSKGCTRKKILDDDTKRLEKLKWRRRRRLRRTLSALLADAENSKLLSQAPACDSSKIRSRKDDHRFYSLPFLSSHPSGLCH